MRESELMLAFLFDVVSHHKRGHGIIELLQALLDKHPHETAYAAWDNVSAQEDDEIEAVVRSAVGRLVLLYLPSYSPWLNPTEMLWQHFRRQVTHCELLESIQALTAATLAFFRHCNAQSVRVLSIIGSNAARSIWLYSAQEERYAVDVERMAGSRPGVLLCLLGCAGGVSSQPRSAAPSFLTDHAPCPIIFCTHPLTRSVGLALPLIAPILFHFRTSPIQGLSAA